jgi:hypothetical protein
MEKLDMPPAPNESTELGRLAGEFRAMEALCTALIACHPKPVILRTAFKSSSGQLLALASASPEASASLLQGMEALLGTFVEAIDHSADRRLASSRLARERMFRPLW